jgi:hypothetical protein
MRTLLQSMSGRPVLLRCALLLSAAGAMLLVAPHIPLLLVLAVFPALFPRQPAPDIYLGGLLFGWLLSTHADTVPAMWRVCALALMLYYLHATAAMSAVMPIDADVPLGTLRRWLLRIVLVTALTVGLSAMVASVQTLAAGGHPLAAATYVALALLVGLSAFLVHLVRRR